MSSLRPIRLKKIISTSGNINGTSKNEIVEILKKMYPILTEVAPNVSVITPGGDAPVGKVENCKYTKSTFISFRKHYLVFNLLKAEKTEKTIINVESSVPGHGTIAKGSWCVML